MLTSVTYLLPGNQGHAFRNIIKGALPGISGSDDLVVWRATLSSDVGNDGDTNGSKRAKYHLNPVVSPAWEGRVKSLEPGPYIA